MISIEKRTRREVRVRVRVVLVVERGPSQNNGRLVGPLRVVLIVVFLLIKQMEPGRVAN